MRGGVVCDVCVWCYRTKRPMDETGDERNSMTPFTRR
jgi:rubredoxin